MSGKVSGSPVTLLNPTVVADLTGEPGVMAGRMLADLGAEVIRPELPTGDPLRLLPHRFGAWTHRTTMLPVSGDDDPALAALLARADIVIDTPGFPGSWSLDPSRASDSVWVSLTPFGLDGPRSHWRASDLGVMAASGNMY